MVGGYQRVHKTGIELMKFAIIANPEKYRVKETFQQALVWAEKHHVEAFFSDNLLSQLDNGGMGVPVSSDLEAIKKGEIIVVIGGDGTMLYSARISRGQGKPILGVNSGRLGFMANTQQEELEYALNCVKENNYKLDKRHLLKAETPAGETFFALNEFLFTRKDTTSMINITAEYDHSLINQYWSDGLIVASPTGSTAYNLSAGGPIVMPNTHVMVLTPINPHTLTTRPLVIDSDKALNILVEEQKSEILFSYDGEVHEVKELPFKVEIIRSDFTVDLIQLPGHDYFETLRNKLVWGLDRRSRK